jgi:hypothetical protein
VTSAAKYLLSSYALSNQLLAQTKEEPKKEIFSTFKQIICKTCKDILIAEHAKQSNSQIPHSELLDLLDGLPEGFLSQFIGLCKDAEISALFTTLLVELAYQIKQTSKQNILEGHLFAPLKKLFALSQENVVVSLLASLLGTETGNYGVHAVLT